ncbi:MAG TPA: hypothetical protein VF322_09735 [Gammaproteobacteria bacterium]
MRSFAARVARGRAAACGWSSLAVALACAGCDPAGDGAGAGSAPAADPPRAAQDAGAVPAGWERYSDAARGVSFSYPPGLGTTYIHVVDWPPQAAVEPGPFTCLAAGEETARAGRTEPVTVDGRTYCVTRVMEGAAGSVYTLYAYAMPAGDDVAILTFSVRAVQCGNYDEPARSACERERAELSMNEIVDRIARTLQVRPTSADGP